MATNTHNETINSIWKKTNMRLIPSIVICLLGAYICVDNGNVRHGSSSHKLVALVGLIIFVLFASTFIHVLTQALFQLISRSHLNKGRAAALRFFMRVAGYIIIVFFVMDLLSIPVGNLLVGGAALGIILGVAAQQALANFFASIILIVSHPFEVGESITINSGALGGKYSGDIVDIGLTHTTLRSSDGKIVLLPNASLLSAATITKE
jgi:small-conductance mechanosensitive channel